jgi:hypothetical protein
MQASPYTSNTINSNGQTGNKQLKFIILLTPGQLFPSTAVFVVLPKI